MSSIPFPRPRAAHRRAAGLFLGLSCLVVLCACSLALGTRPIGPGEVIDALLGRADGIAAAAVHTRVPRTVLAVLVGGALATAGATMQAITRNPLAEPAILGVSSGAALAVVVGIAFFGLAGPVGYLAVAVVGAVVAAAFAQLIGSLGGGGPTPMKLALAGAVTSAACTSLVSAVLLPRIDVMVTFRFWQLGGVGGATWERIVVAAPFLALGAALCGCVAQGLNLLGLGDDAAAGLGTDVVRTRLVAAAGAVLLSGVATSVAGPIAFVGLVVPHVCRAVAGGDHRWLLPLSAVGGAVLLVGADVLGRVVARPGEIDVGVLTAAIGAPVLIGVARRQRVREW